MSSTAVMINDGDDNVQLQFIFSNSKKINLKVHLGMEWCYFYFLWSRVRENRWSSIPPCL